MSKPVASRAWVSAFCIVPVLAIIAVSLFVLSPAHRRSASRSGAAASVVSQPGPPAPAARLRVQTNYASLPLAFEQNQGQTDAQVKYMARGDGYILFLTGDDAVFSLQSASKNSASITRRGAAPTKNHERRAPANDSAAVVRMQLAGGNPGAKVSASDLLPGKSNYFLGSDPRKWHSDVPHYARVSYQDVYPGVNLAFHGAQRQTEFDFVVAPGANPAPIAFRFTGAQGIKTDDSGNLVLSSAAGNVQLHKPVAYQEQNGVRQAVDARFVLKTDKQVTFALGNYDRSRELVIDPSVTYAYSTYLGGSGADEGQGIAFDGSGNAYVTGQTASPNFPGFSSTNKLKGTANAFVTKLTPSGTLGYSTYVGGSASDSGNAIAVDSTSGSAFVAGGTTSTDFPTVLPFQSTLGGGSDAFAFELLSNGTLSYSTYLGGSGDDIGLGIALNQTTRSYAVVGKTASSNFPTHNALQAALNGTSNGFVSLWDSTKARVYSTYLGGGTGDSVFGVALDSSDNAFVTGQTFSTSFPTKNPFQSTCGSCSSGNSNAFVTVINAAGSAYVYSSFLGGSGLDIGDGIAVDSNGNAYVAGTTTSSAFPTTTVALQTVYGGSTDGFITEVNQQGSAMVYSTYLGGTGFDAAASIAVDNSGNAYVTGQTSSSTFPTVGATQSALKGGNDAFVSEINSSGTALVFSTYLGGSLDEDDGGNFGALAVENSGANIYVTGNTASADFPTTTSPLQAANAGGNDAFVVKYSQALTPSFTIGATTPAAVSPGSSGNSTVTLTANNGYNSPVNLTCSVSGGGSPAPTCSTSSFSTNPATPTSSGAQSTLTIATTGPSAAMSGMGRILYAMWLPVGLSLAGLGLSTSGGRRKSLLGLLMLLAVLSMLVVLPACGGGGGGGGGGHGGTPAGSYTVKITGTGTDTNTTTQSVNVTLTVN